MTRRPLRRELEKLEKILKALTYPTPTVRERHDSLRSLKVGKIYSHKTYYKDKISLDERTKAASQRTYEDVLETKETTDKLN